MRAVAGLIAAALIVGACTAPATKTGPTAKADKTVTTTEVNPVSNAEVAEYVFLTVIEEALDLNMTDRQILELGYQVCDGMIEAQDLGLTTDDYLRVVRQEVDDPVMRMQIAGMSGAASSSLCEAELEGWD